MPQEYHARSTQDEVVGNIRRQPWGVGGATIADLNFPDDYLRRIADRVTRSSFEKHFRIVVGESSEPGAIAPELPGKPSTAEVKVCSAPLRPALRQYRTAAREGPPPLPGYRAPILAGATDLWPAEPPTDEPALAPAIPLVATRLAREGLLPTLLHTIEAIGPQALGNRAQRLKTLRRLGLPVDLLPFFEGHETLLDRITAAIQGDSSDPSRLRSRTRALLDEISRAPFRFRPTVEGFRILPETGDAPIRTLRLHATRAEYWGGQGAGSSLDVIRQLAATCPNARIVVAAEESLVHPLAALFSTWPRPARFAIALGRSPLSQWAQDNGKPGRADTKPVTLLPRFASRAEHDTTFVPGDTFIADSLETAGIDAAQSPLLFQGGNLLAVPNPATGQTTLLVGESEVARNTTLGLSREQALDALRVEFGADAAAIAPAVSFHLDFEVSLRAHAGRLLALVNDALPASLIIARAGIDALVASPALTSAEQTRLKGTLTRMLPVDVLAALGPILNRLSVGPGAFPTSLASHFSTAPHDSGVGNLQTFILALDLLAAELLPARRPPDLNYRAYLETFTRRDGDRRRLWRQLESLGAVLVKVPSMADGERSLNYLNGLHEPARYLMPAHGGLYKPLDESAAAALRAALPGVEIVPILCAETQRRSGGLHCAASAF